MFQKILLILIATISALVSSSEVNVYSHRHYDTDKKLFKIFEKQTGIKVNIIKAKASQLIKRIESEGKNTPADVLITSDVGRLVQAQNKGLFQVVQSNFLNKNIPEKLRQKDGYWFALTKRARVIVYNKDTVKADELSTYANLTHKKWYKKLLIRKSNNIYNQSLLASFIASDGRETAKQWAKGIVKNMARNPAGSDRDQMKAVIAGIGDICVANTYYLGKLLNSKKTSEREVAKKIAIFFPNQGVGERGVHINISGAGVIRYSKNKANAIRFIEFLVSKQAQEIFTSANYEYPVNPNVSMSDLLKSWGTFKEDNTPLEEFGINNANAVKVFNEVNWR